MLTGLRGLNGESVSVETWWNRLPRRTRGWIVREQERGPLRSYDKLSTAERLDVDRRYKACLAVQTRQDAQKETLP